MAKKKNMYYNEEVENEKAVRYLAMGDKAFRETDPTAITLKKDIITHAIPIVNGIIFTHKFQRWEPYEDCLQEGMEACFKALERFDPNYIIAKTGDRVLLFNYFSLTAKNCIKYYTMRMQKHRLNYDIEWSSLTMESKDYSGIINLDFIDDFMREVVETIGDDNRYKKIIPIMDAYLRFSGGIFNKREFYKFTDKYKISTNRTRNFLNAIKRNREEIRDKVL